MQVFCEARLNPKSAFDPRSFRWIWSGKARLLIGCPRGEWKVRAKRCTVGTKAYKILRWGRSGVRCRVGRRVVKRS